jgi:hypothetical protein
MSNDRPVLRSHEVKANEVLVCFRESLGDPTFIGALSLLLATKGREAERESPARERE